MRIVLIKDGPKNLSVLIKGIVLRDFEPTPIIELAKLTRPAGNWRGLRLDSAVWAIEEKMGLHLWWNKPEGEADLVMPMESRNTVRLDEGLASPRVEEGWDGIMYLSSFRATDPPALPKAFFVILDFDKQ